MLKLTQYKDYFIEDDGQGNTRLLNGDAELVKEFPNALAAKMWVEINTNSELKT